MSQRREFGARSNEELARLLYQNPTPGKSTQPDAPAQKTPPQPVDPHSVGANAAPEPLASRRVVEIGRQEWPMNEAKPRLDPLSDREERVLYAALSKGSKANLGREPTLPELLQLVERVNDSRAFLRSVEQVLQSNDGIYIDNGRIIFSGSVQRRLQARGSNAA
jgi:hypothetical protein